MYRELVSRLTSDNSWVRIAPPCPEEEIRRTEAALGRAFPEALRELLREMNGDGWCLMSAGEMVKLAELNRETLLPFFEEEFSREEYMERVDRFLFFAQNGCGDNYGYRVRPDGTVDETAIYIWEHELIGETCCWRPVARDLAEFITRYYSDEI